jgi:hypothetical protein
VDDVRVRNPKAWKVTKTSRRVSHGRRRDGLGRTTPVVPDIFLQSPAVRVHQTFETTPAAGLERRVAAAPELVLDVDLKPDEACLLAVRHPSGALTFHQSSERLERSRGRAAPAAATARFHIALRRAPAVDRGRGFVSAAIKVAVLKITKVAADKLVGVVLPKLAAIWEKRIWTRHGLEEGWFRVEVRGAKTPLRLTAGTPVARQRNLLFIHGTFSNAVGAFGALAGTRFFDRVRPLYGDRIYAFNHFTVSRTPEENALQMLQALPDRAHLCDVVTHSRGGLVLRNLVERTGALGAVASRFQLGRAVLVASPNDGTPLATPTRWQETVGWFANLMEVFPDNPFTTGTEFISEALVWLASHLAGDLPGLHSMDAAGRQVGDLQSPPGPPPDAYAALVANFHPDAALWERMIDVGVDQFFGSANDLVVPSEGGWRVDRDGGPYVPGDRIGCFGPGGNLGNGTIHHLNFFGQTATADFLAKALAGEPQGLSSVDPGSPLPDRRFARRDDMKRTRAPRRPPTRTTADRSRQANDTGEGQEGFLPQVLDRTVIAIPLLRNLDDPARRDEIFDLVIDVNLEHKGGREAARNRIEQMIAEVVRALRKDPASQRVRTNVTSAQYVFASLDRDAIRELVRRDTRTGPRNTVVPPVERAIYHIWPDFKLKRLTIKSISTVKADAAHNAFAAFGEDIVWAIVDSGIDGTHPHFRQFKNLELRAPLEHRDFSSDVEAPLVDAYGHGTHVAGIVAGAIAGGRILATTRHLDEHGRPTDVTKPLHAISGMAPRAKLLSLKVLDRDGRGNGTGKASSIIAALEYVQKLNGDGRRILVHGVNLSVGYDFEPEWFACGQSPLCVEVNRLVKSGVVVVVAAGNSGYGFVESTTADQSRVTAGLDLTINDPGNADLAVTVGSTHRDMPHVYGVSYFSSKGPTGDGRMKPDILAPGEKIVSCDSSQRTSAARRRPAKSPAVARYREDSGTSMAAPHVSGVIAAFLSIRHEFVGRPEDVKRIFLSTATDLERAPYFQGRGLVDVMRAIQSI